MWPPVTASQRTLLKKVRRRSRENFTLQISTRLRFVKLSFPIFNVSPLSFSIMILAQAVSYPSSRQHVLRRFTRVQRVLIFTRDKSSRPSDVLFCESNRDNGPRSKIKTTRYRVIGFRGTRLIGPCFFQRHTTRGTRHFARRTAEVR